MNDEQPTCGKGLAENATLPWKLGELAAAMAGVLETHIPSLDLTDENSRKEHDVYQRLTGELRQAAAQLEAIARQMSASRDLPMGPHDMTVLGSETALHSFEQFVQSEQDMLAMLQRKLEGDQQMRGRDAGRALMSERVAVVAGATRGAGRGIARALGETGATVYCTGRSSRVQPNASGHIRAGRPETIEETAEMVTACGGTGISARVDHNADDEVAALFERVQREQNRLDVLAIAMTGAPASWKPFLDEEPSEGRTFVDGWIWPHIVTAWHAAKLMVQHRSGLIVLLVEQDNVGYHGAFYFDSMETLLKRLVFALASNLGSSGVTAVAVAPGFMRTEAILEGYGVSEANWRDAINQPQAVAMGWGGSETPSFVGRAVAALAADPDLARRSGGIYSTRALSEDYGFTDIDGSRPDYAVFDAAAERARKTFLAPMMNGSRFAMVDWKLVGR